MNVQSAYPLVTVKALTSSRDFFVRYLGFNIVFEASWVVIFSAPDNSTSVVLGLMTPDHPSSPPGPEVFNGLGMIVTVQVEDVSTLYQRLQQEGAPITHQLKNEPWGQRRFMMEDPSGILVDVVEQIEPAPGFWEAYMKP